MDIDKIVGDLVEKRFNDIVAHVIGGEMSDAFSSRDDFEDCLKDKVKELMQEELEKRSEAIRRKLSEAIDQSLESVEIKYTAEITRHY